MRWSPAHRIEESLCPGPALSLPSPSSASCCSLVVHRPPSLRPPSTEPTQEPQSFVANVPTDCAAVGTAESRADSVDQLNLQGDGADFVRPVPEGSTLLLGCDWFAGDSQGVLLLISEVDPAAAEAYVATLPGEGYTCVTGDAGNPVCQMVTPNAEFSVDTVETITSREDIWIYSSVTNVDAEMLLGDLNLQIWGN